ncbi:sugar kinase [Peribacillus aracenensis]|uniref:sugar kinase n=1 Tax=Peribacillus aracenensis TaxID=2976708 RepID=UPI0021A8E433|nr:sugar kinase [Peribacillus sp. BBB004]
MDVVTIGETMLLFQPLEEKPLMYSSLYSKTIGGAESNVAIGLTRLGKQARWIGCLGKDPFGDVIKATLAGENVDISKVERDEVNPTSIYFKEIYKVGEPSVYYYRKGSPSSKWGPEHVQEHWFEDAGHLHMTGITPALGEKTLDFTIACMKMAKSLGLTVSFDPNMRFKLWNEEKAKKALVELISLCDIFMPGIDEAEFLLGKGNPENLARKALQLGPQVVAMKLGSEGSLGMLKDGTTVKVSGEKVEKVVDTVGAGDAYAAGFLSIGVDGLDANNLEKALERGNKMGAYIIQGKGDWESLPSLAQMEGIEIKVR